MSDSRQRGVQALFLVSAALFISAIAFIVAAARTRVGSPASSQTVQAAPVASMRQLMIAVVGPNAQKVYDAVSTTITAAGAVDVAPKNDQEWAAVAASAAALVESGYLMLSPDRAVDDGQWMRMTQKFINQAKVALDAANKKDVDGIFAVGGELNMTCDSCHEIYQRK